MQIELKEITVRELANGYEDNQENGVIGYGGKLDIRPPTNVSLSTKTNNVKQLLIRLQKIFPLKLDKDLV